MPFRVGNEKGRGIDVVGDARSALRHHICSMENFDYNEPADVFVASRRLSKRYPMAYHRFQTGAEAIRFVIEVLGADKLLATVVEGSKVRLAGAEIRSLYDSADYPLSRCEASPQDATFALPIDGACQRD